MKRPDITPWPAPKGLQTTQEQEYAIAALPALLDALEAIAHDFRCSDNAELAREALTEAGYTFD